MDTGVLWRSDPGQRKTISLPGSRAPKISTPNLECIEQPVLLSFTRQWTTVFADRLRSRITRTPGRTETPDARASRTRRSDCRFQPLPRPENRVKQRRLYGHRVS